MGAVASCRLTVVSEWMPDGRLDRQAHDACARSYIKMAGSGAGFADGM